MSGNEKLDRELETFLAEENSRVAALYRKLPRHEPDAKLDAAVIAMARSAVATKRSRNYWMPAVSAAAITLLVVGVSYRTVVQQWNQRATLPSQNSVSEPVVAPSASAPQAQAFPAAPASEQAQSVPSNVAPVDAKPVPSPPVSDALARRKADDLSRVRETMARQGAAATAMTKRVDKPADAPSRAAPLQQLDSNVVAPRQSEKETSGTGVPSQTQAEQPSGRGESSAGDLKNASSPLASPAPAPMASPEPATAASAATMKIAPGTHLYPEHWIANIQQLLRDDKRDDALRSLNEFRKNYPDYPLPDELRDLK